MNTEYLGYAVIAIILAVLWIWIAFNAENAPLYEEETDRFTYKEYITFFGIKIFKRKK